MNPETGPQGRLPLVGRHVFYGVLLGLVGVPLVIGLIVWIIDAIPDRWVSPSPYQGIAASLLLVAAVAWFVVLRKGKRPSYGFGGLVGVSMLAMFGGAYCGVVFWT